MRVAIITQYYPPEPVRIPHGLADRGHGVRVLTAYPNYPDGGIAEGYRQRWNRWEDDGKVRVRRLPIFISHPRIPFARFWNYTTFSLNSSLAWSFMRDADMIYVYTTPMTAAFAPHVWRRTKGLPFVLHVQDLWPETVIGSSMVRGPCPRFVDTP